MENTSICVVDDDPAVCRLVATVLGREGAEVTVTGNVKEFRNAALQRKFDIVILDLRLPDGDGLSVASEIRAATDSGIVMLTGKSSTIDTIVGLEMGADDYVSKPFEIRELVARVKSVLRRRKDGAPSALAENVQIGAWTLTPTARRLSRTGFADQTLTNREFAALQCLLDNRGRVSSREQLSKSVYGYEKAPDDRSVDLLIMKLRKKVEEDPSDPRVITTVRSAGYLMAEQNSSQ